MDGILLLAFIFLIAGVVAVPIASKLGLGSVLGYLIAGIAISPLLAALHVDVISLQHFAEFGVVMMLFLVGLELEPRMLWAMKAKLLGLGGLQVGLTTLAVMGVAMMLGQPWTIALAIGLIFALSSTAIVLQTLGRKGFIEKRWRAVEFSGSVVPGHCGDPDAGADPAAGDAGADGRGRATARTRHTGPPRPIMDPAPASSTRWRAGNGRWSRWRR